MLEILEKLYSKRQATGYFFIINEVVYPVYTSLEFTCTMLEAWNLLCDSWLNDLYKKSINPVLPYILRGEVIEDSKLKVGHNLDYYLPELAQVFKVLEFSEVEFEKLYELEEIPLKHKSLVKLVYKYVTYLDSLPWTIKLHLLKGTEETESNKILSNIVKQSQLILKAKRLGSQAGVADDKVKSIT